MVLTLNFLSKISKGILWEEVVDFVLHRSKCPFVAFACNPILDDLRWNKENQTEQTGLELEFQNI